MNATSSRDLHRLGLEAGDRARPRDTECGICYDRVEEPVVTGCLHVFCYECVFGWMQRYASCPTCRERLEAAREQDDERPFVGEAASMSARPLTTESTNRSDAQGPSEGGVPCNSICDRDARRSATWQIRSGQTQSRTSFTSVCPVPSLTGSEATLSMTSNGRPFPSLKLEQPREEAVSTSLNHSSGAASLFGSRNLFSNGITSNTAASSSHSTDHIADSSARADLNLLGYSPDITPGPSYQHDRAGRRARTIRVDSARMVTAIHRALGEVDAAHDGHLHPEHDLTVRSVVQRWVHLLQAREGRVCLEDGLVSTMTEQMDAELALQGFVLRWEVSEAFRRILMLLITAAVAVAQGDAAVEVFLPV